MKFYKVEYESQADIRVYIEEFETQADLNVLYVECESQANKPGLWFWVNYELQAGWKNTLKSHLLD